MADELEGPANADQLYAARGDEIPRVRPYMQGDVFRDVEIPGVEDGPGYAAILAHPCSMRADGVALFDRLQLARVESGHAAPLNRWKSGYFRQMPLPELLPDEGDKGYAVMFDLAGRVATDSLLAEKRVAALSPYGISLLQQRHVHHLTRYVVPSAELHATCVHVLHEAELLEEWLIAAEDAHSDLAAAATAFHDFIRADREGGSTLQADLKDEAKRAGVRRAVLDEQRRCFG